MTNEELDRLEALCAAATPEPWRILWERLHPEHGAFLINQTSPGGGGNCLMHSLHREIPLAEGRKIDRHEALFKRAEDAEVAAEARMAIPALIAEVRRLRALLP